MKEDKTLIGRQWPISQKDSSIISDCLKIPAIQNNCCNRCGSLAEDELPNGKKYCRVCINIGRITEDDILVRFSGKQNRFKKVPNGGLTWNGILTPKQEKISSKLVAFYQEKVDALVHAVTGAGKTEMLFKVIAAAISAGDRVCIATPRIDVVNELFPRLCAAFQEIKIGKYHGKEYQEPDYEQLTICTTHQLLKFYQAFDLLIIDEVDSFPFADNSALHFAAKNAVKSKGMRLFLTATPTDDLLEEVKEGKIQILKLNRRFHGGKLPVPKEKLFLKPFIYKKQLNLNLVKQIKEVVENGHQLLLFVPRIEQIPWYVEILNKIPEFKDIEIEGVHAADKNRLDKVENFRKKQISILVTTTILERGVTFKGVWVIIVQADDEIYTKASLVQIAGRVGRDKNDPDGLVLFCYQKYTANIAQAVAEIREMNR